MMEIRTKPYGDVARGKKREAAMAQGFLCCSIAVATIWLCGKTGLVKSWLDVAGVY